MRITLKNIKYADFASQETYCYSASVYFDKKRVGTVRNEGHGGCDYQTPIDDAGWNAMIDYIDSLNPADTEEQKGAAMKRYCRKLKEWGDDSYWDFEQSDADFYHQYKDDQHHDKPMWVVALEFNRENLETICHNLVSEWLIDKEVKKFTRQKIAFYTGEFDGYYNSFSTRKFPESAIREYLATEKPDAVIINDLPIEKQRELFA